MGLYIDNGKTVKHYCTSRRVEKAIETLLNQDEELAGSETHEGYEVAIRAKDRKDFDYLLLSTIDRESVHTGFRTKTDANNAMKAEFKSVVAEKLDLITDEDIEASEACGIGDGYAWINTDDYEYDWSVVDTSLIREG